MTYVLPPALLWVGLWSCGAVALLLLVSMVLARARRQIVERRDHRRMAPLRPLLLELAAEGEAVDQEVTTALSTLPASSRDVVDDAIVAMLGKIRGDSVAPLVAVLHRHDRGQRSVRRLTHASAVVRAHAVWSLGVMRERESVPSVLPFLHDPSPEVVLTTARALGMMGDPIAAGPILEAVATDGPRTGLPVWVAVESVALLGTGISTQVRAALTHPSIDVRTTAAMAIARVPVVAAAESLRQALKTETDPQLVAMLVLALGEVGGARDLELLGPLLATDHHADIRRTAIAAVAEVGGDRAVTWLCPLLHSRDIRVAELTATTLVTLGSAGYEAVSAVANSGALSPSGRLCRYAVARETLQRSLAVRQAL